MTIRRRATAPPARDMDASPFASILSALVSRIPGALAAALVDAEGETVDYTGVATPFDVKIAAAHWQIILRMIDDLVILGHPRHLVVRGSTGSVIARKLADGYSMVILLSRGAGFGSCERAFSACMHLLTIEAGWERVEALPPWFPITVTCDERKRPIRIVYGGLEEPVEVLGSVMGLSRHEHGFRIRLASGPEITIVREPGGHWYAEEKV